MDNETFQTLVFNPIKNSSDLKTVNIDISTLNKSEKFAIRNLFILIHYCHELCTRCASNDNYTGCVECRAGAYFLRGLGCVDCSNNCETCDINATNCLTCRKGLYKELNNTCQSSCSSSYFMNSITKECERCHNECAECFGPTPDECLVCHSDKYLINSLDFKKCLSSCPENYFPLETPNKLCRKCHSTCKKCLGESESQCISCYDSKNCLRCKASNIFECLVCNPQTSFLLPNGACYEGSACPPFYFELNQTSNSENRECRLCYGGMSNLCKKCLDEQEYNCIVCEKKGCKRCMAGNDTCNEWEPGCIIREDKCVDECPIGEFKFFESTNSSNPICRKCDDNCLNCITNEETCLSCKEKYYLKKISDFPWATCSPCKEPCLNCFAEGKDSCLSCDYQKYFLKNKNCITLCPREKPFYGNEYECLEFCDISNGYYLGTIPVDGGAPPKICKKCSEGCKTCNDEGISSCTSCYQERYYRMNGVGSIGSCVKFCPRKDCKSNQYFYNDNIFNSWEGCGCKFCDTGCLCCENNPKCATETECLPTFKFNSTLKQCLNPENQTG